jgi:hypothetical protein
MGTLCQEAAGSPLGSGSKTGPVEVGEGVAVDGGVRVGVRVGCSVAVADGFGVAVGLGEGVTVGEGDGVGVGGEARMLHEESNIKRQVFKDLTIVGFILVIW